MKIKLFFFLLALEGCSFTARKPKPTIVPPGYDQIILNLALNTADFDLIKIYSSRQADFELLKQNILMKSKVVRDDTLGVTLVLHSWSNFGGDFPKTIISVVDDSTVVHAFAFNDEYHHHLDIMKDDQQKLMFGRLAFGDHLNFVLNKIGQHIPLDDIRVNRFVTLLGDSLLGLNEYKTTDSVRQRNEIVEIFDQARKRGQPCEESADQNFASVVESLQNGKVRLFSCMTGRYGFWKFEISHISDGNVLMVTFLNAQCYTVTSL